MLGAFFRPLVRPGWRRKALAAGSVAAVAAAVWLGRGALVHRASAQPAASTAPAAAPLATSDYGSRVVAYVHQNQAITRQDLGEFLIARNGADKLPLLVNKRILDDVCKQHNIVVTAAEVDAALGEQLKDIPGDRQAFLKSILSRYKKNLYEFKEDIIRPRLQLTRLVQPQLKVTEEELRQGYEVVYGEKIECRMIVWPLTEKAKAEQEYPTLHSEAAFVERAKKQPHGELASSGGKIKPIARYVMDKAFETAAFKLQPGQLSELIQTRDGYVVLRCERRIPPDTAVNFNSVRAKLERDILENKLRLEMGNTFKELSKKAMPHLVLKKSERPEPGPTPPPSQPVATIFGTTNITREDLGEFLIARFGAERLEFLVNHRLLDEACKEKNITISDSEIEKGLKEDLTQLNVTKDVFEKDLLGKWGKNLYEWREDVIRPRLMLTKLCQGRVKWSADDLDKCFQAYHGERLECRMILYPPDQAKFAMREYAVLRDNESEFARKAKSQASPTLASQGGKLPVFGRHSLDNEELEREAFKLRPGEVTALIGTPQGQVILKCDKRIPPDKTVTLDKVRDKLIKEIVEKKTQLEMQVVFRELQDRAKPRLLLRGTGQPEDLAAQARQLMSDLPPLGAGAAAKGTGAGGNR